MKRHVLDWKKAYAKHTSVKGFLQLNNKETKYSIKIENQAKGLRGYVANGKIKVINKHMKICSMSLVLEKGKWKS